MMSDIYDGQTHVGTVSVHERGFIALDAAGKRLGIFPTRLGAVKAVLDVARAEKLLEAIEASMKAKS